MNIFVLTDLESKRERKFRKSHPNIRYILTPTGVCLRIDLECLDTKIKEDITDYDNK